ncbi:hypothetical protein PR202_ga06153 [Eleusine coracana subsp. coracana]|uniref:PWWP domain-containing protein n=1 Tax=Eleusine coracana subsp. coracana TaxID=191504 RepID=A0AAV5BU36_ELECO|nr:hypothetical protein PR202_ga06153 [Eleusine coracana subsp. coracana]
MGVLSAGEAEAPEVDVSAEGTLVWLRRPNGTWWPSIVISPSDVPDGCPAPPRCPAIPIMLLGRRDGATFVDWCNIGRCKRVKPFRCGELDFEQRITKAQALDASRLGNKRRYARIEDAVLQALEIERARAPPSPNKKRKTPNDSEDDAPPKGSRRMRDLSDLSTPDLSSDALTSHLPALVNNQAKRSKQHAHATTAKRTDSAAASTSRKKDRSRPLSELCNGDFISNAQTADAHLMDLTSSGTSTLRKTCSPCSRTDPPKLTQVSTINGILVPHFDDLFVKPDPLAAPSILEPDDWPTCQPCVSPKYPTWKHPTQSNDCSKADLSFQRERDNFQVKTIGYVHQEGSKRTRNAPGHKHQKSKEAKLKAPRNEVALSEKKPDKLTLNNPSEHGDNMCLEVFPADLDCVAAVQQQHSERNCDLGESSGTISNSSDCVNSSLSTLVFELPLRALPPLKKAPELEVCDAVKPMKTLQLNSALYDVQLSSRGISDNGRRVPLVSLMISGARWQDFLRLPSSGDDDVVGTRWAVLIAGSNGYYNYRHQADVCHAYQIMKKGGLKDENIIVFMYDDIANNPDNPRPGVIINHPTGGDVYAGVPKDYTGEDVNAKNFLAVLLGDRSAVTGGKVVDSGPEDHIFVYYSDHGGPGVLGMPSGDYLYAKDLVDTLKKKHTPVMELEAGGYKSMVFLPGGV